MLYSHRIFAILGSLNSDSEDQPTTNSILGGAVSNVDCPCNFDENTGPHKQKPQECRRLQLVLTGVYKVAQMERKPTLSEENV